MESNYLGMDSVISYLLQYKLNELLSFKMIFTSVSDRHWAQNKTLEDGFSPSSFLSTSLCYPLLFGKNYPENSMKGKSYCFRLTCVKLICLQK